MPAKPIEYPQILTNADWQKKKGLIAKGKGETGIGAQMNKTKAAFEKIDWKKFDAEKKCGMTARIEHIDQIFQQAISDYSKDTKPVREELKKLQKLADETAKEWDKSKVVPASSVKHVKSVATEADHLFIAFKETGVFITDLVKDFAEEKKKLKKRQAETAKMALSKYFKSLPQYGDELEKNPSITLYIGGATTGFHQNIRGVAAALAKINNEAYTKHSELWNGFADDSFIPKVESQVKPKVEQVLKALTLLESLKL